MCKCTGQSLSAHTHTWARGETRFKCAHSLCKSSLYLSAQVWFCARAKEICARAKEIRARAKEIRARAGKSAREQRKSAREQGDSRESKGNPRASREIRAQAGRFALAHYINLLSSNKNALSTFGSKITPYIYCWVFCGIVYTQQCVKKCLVRIEESVLLQVVCSYFSYKNITVVILTSNLLIIY